MKPRTRSMIARRRRRRRPHPVDVAVDHEFEAACKELDLPPGIYPRTLVLMLAGL